MPKIALLFLIPWCLMTIEWEDKTPEENWLSVHGEWDPVNDRWRTGWSVEEDSQALFLFLLPQGTRVWEEGRYPSRLRVFFGSTNPEVVVDVELWCDDGTRILAAADIASGSELEIDSPLCSKGADIQLFLWTSDHAWVDRIELGTYVADQVATRDPHATRKWFDLLRHGPKTPPAGPTPRNPKLKPRVVGPYDHLRGR